MTIWTKINPYAQFVAIFPGGYPDGLESSRPTPLHNLHVNPDTGSARIDCVWAIHAPNGTKIKLEVFYYKGEGMLLSVFDENDPVDGTPILVKDSPPHFYEGPVSVLSHQPQMTIVLRSMKESSYISEVRLIITPYKITGKISI